jgi:monofunctional biosynthetic peptidoglycan transglycosylase
MLLTCWHAGGKGTSGLGHRTFCRYHRGMARRSSRGLFRALRILCTVIAVLVAIPVVLTPVYLVVDPVSVPMLERYLTGRPVVRTWRDIDEISDRLKASVILSEDGQFCRHLGVDFGALREEVDNFLSGEKARGASTLTMQVARNLFLWNDQSYIRKALEIPLALYIDLVMPKKRIMEIYLNIAEWGPQGEFGIVAGSDRAFGRAPQNLDWRTASLLAVTLPNPLVRNPARPTNGLLRVARIVEGRAQQFGERANCVGPGGRLSL